MTLQRAIAWILTTETGTLIEDPAGGLTRWGIALARHPDLTEEDIRNMTTEGAAKIYAGPEYAGAIHASVLPDGLMLPMMDAAVLQGAETAIKCLQRTLYLTDDGKFGPRTTAAVKVVNVPSILPRFAGERIVAMSEDGNWVKNRLGWATRVTATVLAQ